MNSKIIFTFFSRVMVSLLNFIVVAISAKYMGAEARGNITLIMVAITFSNVLHQFVGGNPLVYFARKTALKNLLIPSYLWAFISSAVVTFLLVAFKQLPQEFAMHVFVLSVIQSLLSTHLTLLLSFEKIKEQNLIIFFQAMLTATSLAFLLFVLKSNTVLDYLIALYVAYGCCFIISTGVLLLHQMPITNEIPFSKALLKSLLNYGLVIQSTNIIQLFNYRLSYFIINAYQGTAALGVFSTAVAVGESVWLFSKSLTNVQYPKIVHATDSDFKINITIKYAKVALLTTALLMLLLVFMPSPFYQYVFGKQFEPLKMILCYLAPGLIAMGYTSLYAHYFSGISRNLINLLASTAAVFLTIAAGFYFIPKYGSVGSCLVFNLSYISSSLFLVWMFIKITNKNLMQLLPGKRDLKEILTVFEN